MAKVMFVGNPNRVVVDELRAGSNNFLNNDTVVVTLLDIAGAQIAGETWPFTMTYEAGSNGKYEAVLSETLDIEEGMLLTSIIDGGTTFPEKAHFECLILVDTRRCET